MGGSGQAVWDKCIPDLHVNFVSDCCNKLQRIRKQCVLCVVVGAGDTVPEPC